MARALRIDFARVRTARGRLPWLLAGIGVLSAGAVLIAHHRVSVETRTIEASIGALARGHARQAPAASAADARSTDRAIESANRIVERLQEPWLDLLEGIEGVSHDRVALLALEPDATRGQVRLTGEARDAAALGEYLARLAKAGGLADVHLTQHETRDARGTTVLRFAITSKWKGYR